MMKKEDVKQMFDEDDEVMETWNTDPVSSTFRNQQHQIDMLVAIINEFTEESATLAKAMEHIVRRLDNIEKFLDQINREVGEDHDENRVLH
jgi:predicted RNase H-like nuclease (RuvC/YqgF family)